MTNALVSICLPVYNGENYLAKAIESVLNQSFHDFELLILDDCSTDRTSAIASDYAGKDKRIKIFRNEENLGLFRNYNKCMEKASGTFIKLFAHDDLFEPTILERMLAIFDKEANVALVAVSKGWVDENGCLIEATSASELKTMRPFESDTRLASKEAICQTLSKMANWLGEPCSQMFRKEHVSSGFDTRFRQVGDLDFSYRLLAHGDYYFLADELCYFRKHEMSNTQRFSRSLEAWLDWFVLAAKHKAYISDVDEYCQLLTRRLAGILHMARFDQGKESRTAIVDSFLGANVTALSNFISEMGTDRVNLGEFKTLAVFSLLEVANLQEERRLAQNQLDFNDKTIAGIREELTQLRQRSEAELKELRENLTDMGNSLSWKITAPLRACKRTLEK